MQSAADGFLAVIMAHADGAGHLSEEFNRYTGFECGAADLTWSYGAFLEAVSARKVVLGTR
jgi:glucoamylase